MAEALAIIEDLKQAVLNGTVKAVVAVGITPDHGILKWTTSTSHTSRLEIMGAVAAFEYDFHADE